MKIYLSKLKIPLFLCIIFTLTLSLTSLLYSAPLKYVPQTIKQPDGSVIQCFASGDEFYNWLHDKDGYTIIQNRITGYYVYAKKVNDELVPSEYVVGLTNPASLNIRPWLKISAEEYEKKRNEKYTSVDNRMFRVNKNSKSRIESSGSLVPHEGTMNTIVIFVRFSSDPEFSNQVSAYERLFNANSGSDVSLYNYFKEVSYNKFSILSSFYPVPNGNQVVSYQDPHPRNYYRTYNAATNPDGYDPNVPFNDYQNTAGKTYREHTLLKNAISAVESQISTGVNIDSDNDGWVDNICFIIKGAPDGWNDLLWPHQWRLWSQQVTIHQKAVVEYNFELDDKMEVGVLCHESFHVLGAPDLYHYSQDEKVPVGPWDVMEWTADIPEHMGSFMKYRYGGWIDNIPEIKKSGTYTLNPLTSSNNNCFKIQSPNSFTEYFVIEYRKKLGIFENSIPGDGLIVYRINLHADNIGNASGPPDEVYIYRPGGTTTNEGDILNAFFCQSANRTAINDNSDPKCFLYDGSAGGLNISGVGMAGDQMSFNVNIDYTPREYLNYDKGYYAGLGTNQAGNFHAAVKFTPTELSECYGSNLTNIMIFIQEGGGKDVTIKVWKGSSGSGPNQIVYEKNISNEVKLNDWTVHTLANPVNLTSGEDYWIGYQINSTGGFPMGYSLGSMKEGKGGWLDIGEGWKQLSNYSLNGNWNIRGVVQKEGAAVAVINTSQLNYDVKPGETGKANFTIRNTGAAQLVYNISATGGGKPNGVRLNTDQFKIAAGINKEVNSNLTVHGTPALNNKIKTKSIHLNTEDVLYLDDGNESPTTFIGYGSMSGFTWINKFDLQGYGFDLKKIWVYLRSEDSYANNIAYAIYNKNKEILYYGSASIENSPDGSWFEIQLDSTYKFKSGENFYLQIDSYNMALYPAGFDLNATVKNNSFYIPIGSMEFVNMNTVPDFANGAFLIRAVGSKNSGTENQPPVVKGVISKFEASVGEELTFDASQSYDPDGQIASYNWAFGDGQSSSQAIAKHAYSAAGNYNVNLTVTDNKGASASATAQIKISGSTNNQPPNAVANVSKNTAGIGEVINFDGTQSNDPDGQIVNYSWEFGDGQTASGSTASHSYSAAGVFTYKLIVTDNKNATDEATGQITISGSASRFTINPAHGTINPGESMTISVDYNSSGLNEGNYQGQVSITSNGGNFTLPVAIIISQYSDVNGEEEIVTEYELNQNYPNPFNASTIINFAIPQSGNTELSVYDISGRLVRKLIYNDLKAGKYKITFEASGLSSGIYFYRLRSGMYIKTNKLVLIK